MLAPHISVVNLGCRVNRVESDRITADLMRLGFAMVEPQDAELIVINTCAVTGEAEAKTRKAVRHALAHPNEPYVIVTGCVVNLHPEELLELSDRVIAEPSKIDVADRVCEVLGVESDSVAACSDSDVVDALGRSRLGVKIQDGCNHRCTYCIVWKARGPERSVPVESVLEQVLEAQEAGVPEVVLTGVNLGAYDGKSATDEHVEIDELLETIMERTSIPHVRISSVEPMDISERLLKVMARYPQRIAPFLHLPVQSGCTATLHRMGRPYSAESFEGTVRMFARFCRRLRFRAMSSSVFPARRTRSLRSRWRSAVAWASRVCTCSATASAPAPWRPICPTRWRPRSWLSAAVACARRPRSSPLPTPVAAWAPSSVPCSSMATT